MNRAESFTLILGVLAVAACGDGGDPVAPDAGGDSTTLDFQTDVQSIFNSRCGPACHGAGGNGGLDLRPGQSRANLVGVTSPTYGAVRVVPDDPGSSVLYDKITGGGKYGGRMPASGPQLDSTQIEVIRSWILAGAPPDSFPR